MRSSLLSLDQAHGIMPVVERPALGGKKVKPGSWKEFKVGLISDVLLGQRTKVELGGASSTCTC